MNIIKKIIKLKDKDLFIEFWAFHQGELSFSVTSDPLKALDITEHLVSTVKYFPSKKFDYLELNIDYYLVKLQEK